jgi:hypothetical protein
LKSTAFAELFAWQCGVNPNDLTGIDFRIKLDDRPAWDYGVEVYGRSDGKTVSRSAVCSELYGTDWGMGFFKYKACDYCDDIVGETADVSIGDAWLPKYRQDSKGTNLAVVRSPELHQILSDASARGALVLDDVTTEQIVTAQEACFRHRRNGLAYRLHLADLTGEWRPPKRVRPDARPGDRRFRRIQRLRLLLAQRSHVAWKEAVARGDFRVFVNRMEPLVRKYRACYQSSMTSRCLKQAKRAARFGKRLVRFSARAVRRIGRAAGGCQ